MHGTLPEVKIFIKKNEISIHEDKLKVIDFHKNKFSLNGYDFQINRNMTTEDFFSYIDRILRSQKNSSWNWVSKAYASGMWSKMISAATKYVVESDESIQFNKELTYLNNNQKNPLAVKDFKCSKDNLNFMIENTEKRVSITMMDNKLTDDERNRILDQNIKTTSAGELVRAGYSLFNAASLKRDELMRSQKEREKNKQLLAKLEAANHSITKTMEIGRIRRIYLGQVNVAGDGEVNWESDQFCLVDKDNIPHCTEKGFLLRKRSKLHNQFEALSYFYKKEYDKIVEDCKKETRLDIRVGYDEIPTSSFNKCPQAKQKIDELITPYWTDIQKAQDQEDLQLDNLSLVGYNCYLNDKNKDGCCQQIKEYYNGSKVRGYRPYKGGDGKVN